MSVHIFLKQKLRILLTYSEFSETNDCSPNPCKNGAKCLDLAEGYHCLCASGYNGSNCETSNYLPKWFFV